MYISASNGLSCNKVAPQTNHPKSNLCENEMILFLKSKKLKGLWH